MSHCRDAGVMVKVEIFLHLRISTNEWWFSFFYLFAGQVGPWLARGLVYQSNEQTAKDFHPLWKRGKREECATSVDYP